MSVILDKEIYQWLLALEAIKVSTYAKELENGKIEVDPAINSYFSSGLIFSKLIHQIVKTLPKNTSLSPPNLKSLDSMKFSQNAASKIYNWNIALEALKKLEIHVDSDVKNLIINGDLDMLNDLLREIYSHYHPKHESREHLGLGLKPYESVNTSMNSMVKGTDGNKSKPKGLKMRPIEETIDINTINPNKELTATTSCLEFFIVSLCKHLSLNSKQAVALLSNGFKYLAHLLAKGVKGVFEPIVYWYQEVYANAGHLLELILKDRENNVNLVQQACKPGLLAKNMEVVQWACRLFSKLAFEFSDHGIIGLAWDWFVGENGGLHACLLGLKRHPDISESVISVLVQYARYNMIEMFTLHLKNVCADAREHLGIMRDLFKPLTESKFTKEEISSSGIIDAWMENTLKYSEEDPNHPKELRLAALSFLCDMWFMYPNRIEDQDHIAAGILNSLKRAIREESKTFCLSAITLLLKLLDRFATEKDNYAAVVYKTLTFCVVENYDKVDIRDFILTNFNHIFRSNTNIPLGVLLEPLMKQIHLSQEKYVFNLFDFEFFGNCIKHPKFTSFHAIQLFYIMADIYLNNIPFSRLANQIIIEVLNNHLNKNEKLEEAVIKFSKAALAMFYTSEKTKRPKEKVLPKYNSKAASVTKPLPSHEIEKETINAQKRALVIEIMKSIISINDVNVNDRLKTFVLYTHVQLKNFNGTEHRGLLMLIALYGEPEKLVEKFEKELKGTGSAVTQSLDATTDRNRSIDKIHKSVEDEAMSFLRDLEMGKKKKPKEFRLSRAELSDILLKKLSKPDPKVVEEINAIKREQEQKKQKKLEEEEIEKKKLEKQKKDLQEQLEKRKIELGVATKNKKDEEKEMIFAEGSLELAKIVEKNKAFPQIEVISLNDEEDRDKEVVSIMMKKYQKVIKHLFNSYCNSGFSNEGKDSFTNYSKRASNITIAELWKMLSDHDCGKYLEKDEVKALVRLVNTQLLKRDEISNLSQEGFDQFLIQVAIFMFGRPPKNLGHLPVFISVEELFKTFRQATARKGKSTMMYDDPDQTEMGDKALNLHLNEQLKDNPDFQLPDQYKRVEEKAYEIHYNLPPALKVEEKYLMAYELMDEILHKAIGIRLMEPAVNFNTVYKAKLRIFNPLNVANWSNQHHMKPVTKALNSDRHIRAETSPDISKKKRVLSIDNKPPLNFTLKKEVAKASAEDRPTVNEVAEVLEEMLLAVADGITELPKRDEKKYKIINKAILIKKAKETSLEKLHEEQNKKMLGRREEMKEQLGDLQEFRKKQKEDRQKKKEEAEAQQKMMKEVERQKFEERKKQNEQKKENVKAFKEKKKQEEEEKKREAEEKAKLEKEKKKSEFQEFNNKQLDKYKSKFDDIKNQREDKKKKDEEEGQLKRKRK